MQKGSHSKCGATALVVAAFMIAANSLAAHGAGFRELRLNFRSARQGPTAEEGELIAKLWDARLLKADPAQVWQAVERLGQMRSLAAIEDLARLLALRRSFEGERTDEAVSEISLITIGQRYPAVGALTAIGLPALPALVMAIEKHPTGSVEADNATGAIFMIFRDDPAGALKFLKKAKTASPSRKAAQRLDYSISKTRDLLRNLNADS
ncbi:MAG: hypothetical protein ACREDR_26605 [Blastocatellia bacterium]